MNARNTRDTANKLFESYGGILKLPERQLRLDDARLMEYRYPAERQRLVIALVTIALLVFGGFLFREKDILLAAGAVYLSMLVASIQAKTLYRLQGAEVTPTQFPAIYKIVEELQRRFQAPPIRVFVVRRMMFKADALGLVAPYVIVLPHVVIDSMEDDELHFVLGQAFGHICFGHTRVALLMGGDESALPALLSWIGRLRDLIFAGYLRAATLSADRAGILACGSIVPAIRAQVKLSVGVNQLKEVRTEDLIQQAVKVNQGFAHYQAMVIRWRSPVPPFIHRLEAMLEWAGLPPESES
ncbi:MAG: M48 family metalloprotease [Paraburkholderia sp.]|uniref:M48 family metalloprotease n=1 Tax=Paraburkholderia sp. TaxID=1926495 RepID=UPI003C468265